MIKQTKKHTIYEIWNEWAAESVFVDHKPTKEEVEFVVEKNWGPVFRGNCEILSIKEFIRKHIIVDKLPHMYTTV